MKMELGLDERDPGCFLHTYSVVMVLRKVRFGFLLFPHPLEPLLGLGICGEGAELSTDIHTPWAMRVIESWKGPIRITGFNSQPCPGLPQNPHCALQAALKQLPKNKVPSMAVMIKTLTRSSAGAGAVFRDPTGEWGCTCAPGGSCLSLLGLRGPVLVAGEMQGTVHRLLLEQRQSELRAGSVLLLRQVRRAGGAAHPTGCGVSSQGNAAWGITGVVIQDHPSHSQPRYTLEL